MLDFIFAILAALTWSSSNIIIRRGLEKFSFLAVSAVITVTGTAVFIPLALLLLSTSTPHIESIPFFLLAGLIQPGATRLLYYKGMEKVGASINSSIAASSPIFSTLLAALLLGEEVGLTIWVGAACVVVGSVILQSALYAGEIGVKGSRRDVVYPLSAAALGGVGWILRKQGLNLWNSPVVGVALGYLATLTLYLLIFKSKAIPETGDVEVLNRRTVKAFWKPGIGISLGHLLSFYALSYGNVSVVAPLLQTQPLFILLLANIYLKGIEKVTLRLVSGVLSIIAGVTLIVK